MVRAILGVVLTLVGAVLSLLYSRFETVIKSRAATLQLNNSDADYALSNLVMDGNLAYVPTIFSIVGLLLVLWGLMSRRKSS